VSWPSGFVISDSKIQWFVQFDYSGFVPRSRPALALTEAEEQRLCQWVPAFGTPQQVCLRSRIVLAASGQSDSAIALELDVNRNTVILWRRRFRQEGLDGLWEIAPGRGPKPTYGPEKVESIIDATLRTKPKGTTQWSCRLMAAGWWPPARRVSISTINNIWQSHNLKPHRVKTFKLSRDAKFLEKLTDVVGLYLNPPQQAIVLCVDENSQIQALDRTQPGLPIKKGLRRDDARLQA
jgi:transposase